MYMLLNSVNNLILFWHFKLIKNYLYVFSAKIPFRTAVEDGVKALVKNISTGAMKVKMAC